jgi:hypothetical protein
VRLVGGQCVWPVCVLGSDGGTPSRPLASSVAMRADGEASPLGMHVGIADGVHACVRARGCVCYRGKDIESLEVPSFDCRFSMTT